MLTDMNKKHLNIEKSNYENHIPNKAFYTLFKREMEWTKGEIEVSWHGERNHLFLKEDGNKDDCYIGYSNPVGSSRGIHTNPKSGIECLFRVDLIRSVDYIYFQRWHIEKGSDWTLEELLQDEKNGISHRGKVGVKVTIKPTDSVVISSFFEEWKNLRINKDGKIVKCDAHQAQIRN